MSLETVVVHIAGPPGSGKTTLGEKLKNKLGSTAVIKDLDDLRHEYILKTYGKRKWTYINDSDYQKFINKFIASIYGKKELLVFVGLNDNPLGKNKKKLFNLQADDNYFIEISDKELLERRVARFLQNISNDKILHGDLIKNNAKAITTLIKGIRAECSLAELKKQNKVFQRLYANYKRFTADKILDMVYP